VNPNFSRCRLFWVKINQARNFKEVINFPTLEKTTMYTKQCIQVMETENKFYFRSKPTFLGIIFGEFLRFKDQIAMLRGRTLKRLNIKISLAIDHGN